MVKRTRKIALALVAVVGMLLVPAAIDAASWGAGASAIQNGGYQATSQVRDTKADGHCIRIKVLTNNSWTDTGVSHCSGSWGTYQVQIASGGPIASVRMYRGWTGQYETIS